MVVAELEKTLSSFPVVDSVVSLLDGVVEKLSALKRKVRDANARTHTHYTLHITYMALSLGFIKNFNNSPN